MGNSSLDVGDVLIQPISFHLYFFTLLLMRLVFRERIKMKVGYYKSYEVTTRFNGKRIRTVTFGKLNTIRKYIDRFITHRIEDGGVSNIYVQDYKVLIYTNKGDEYKITVVQVEREFANIRNLFSIN